MTPPKAPFSKYDFSVAPLPRAVYFALRDLLTKYPDSTRWTMVVAAICLMVECQEREPDKLAQLLEKVRTAY